MSRTDKINLSFSFLHFLSSKGPVIIYRRGGRMGSEDFRRKTLADHLVDPLIELIYFAIPTCRTQIHFRPVYLVLLKVAV